MIDIGATAKALREALCWSQRETAAALGVTPVHLSNVENGKSQPSQALLSRYRELWGIDLYVFAWCNMGDLESLPAGVKAAASKLSAAWRKRVEELIREQRKDTGPGCSS